MQVGGHARANLGPGDYFGEISLIDGKPRSASVAAETELRTIFLARWNFAVLLDDEPEVTKNLLLAVCARLRLAESH